MNKKGQLAGWEAVIILILLISNGLAFYWLVNRAANQSIYQKGSKATVTNVIRRDWPFSIHIGEGGCATMRGMEKEQNNNPNETGVKDDNNFK